ncbi:hypothetical protein P8625_12045 [Tenacibaculum tangerinum]|uniref:Uncharacterized protein n=1 Tax=Tenacibaculum tangerinum TaxID=3038772 RepID=A0ABY8L0J3_9FLAO|nr:hypothetical protein [Tenacibaculum tangerinum]WGH74809.1 hypothetical protein P8625_12045 [Tenacibaculum tangerinum]
MKLTDQHIKELYTFTRQHYVEHYDVQTELVDHLANDIEQLWEEKPTLSFEQARDASFKKFGVFGFMNIVEEKQKQLGKKYRTILWKHVKEWFRLPKIILTIGVFFFFYYCMQISIGIYVLGVSLLILAILNLYWVLQLKKEFKKRTRKNHKKWMLEELIFNVASFGGILVASNLPQLFTYAEKTPSNLGAFSISLLITLAIVYSYITLVIIPKKAEVLLQEQYPEYKIANNLMVE